MRGGGAERERETGNRSRFQALSRQHRVQCGAGASELRDHDLSQSGMLNRLSHPRAPMEVLYFHVNLSMHLNRCFLPLAQYFCTVLYWEGFQVILSIALPAKSPSFSSSQRTSVHLLFPSSVPPRSAPLPVLDHIFPDVIYHYIPFCFYLQLLPAALIVYCFLPG